MADNEKLNPQQEPEDNDIIDMVDEDGNHTLFEHIATLEYENETYLALAEAGTVDSDDEEDLEIIILRIDQDENGNDIYVTPDEDTAQAVLEDLINQIEEMDDEEAD